MQNASSQQHTQQSRLAEHRANQEGSHGKDMSRWNIRLSGAAVAQEQGWAHLKHGSSPVCSGNGKGSLHASFQACSLSSSGRAVHTAQSCCLPLAWVVLCGACQPQVTPSAEVQLRVSPYTDSCRLDSYFWQLTCEA